MELSLGRVHLVHRQSLNVANPARVQNLSVGNAASSHRKASAFPKGTSTRTRERFETCVRSRKGNLLRTDHSNPAVVVAPSSVVEMNGCRRDE